MKRLGPDVCTPQIMHIDRKLVLIVDDDSDLRITLGDVLVDSGYQVQLASNGVEALDVLERGLKPDLILLDLMMPVMNGWQFLRHRAAEPAFVEIPVVAISAAGSFIDAVDPADAEAFLRKPLSLDDLLNTVFRCCRGRA